MGGWANGPHIYADVDTQHQVSRHKSFAPEVIRHHSEPSLRPADEERTPLLAKPPAWMQRDDLPCLGRHEEFDHDFPGRVVENPCAGCPVIQECLEDAMAQETGSKRYGIRGNLSAKDRVKLAQEQGRDVEYERRRERVNCPLCDKEMSRDSLRRHINSVHEEEERAA